jgi:hypothetical protein
MIEFTGRGRTPIDLQSHEQVREARCLRRTELLGRVGYSSLECVSILATVGKSAFGKQYNESKYHDNDQATSSSNIGIMPKVWASCYALSKATKRHRCRTTNRSAAMRTRLGLRTNLSAALLAFDERHKFSST